MSDRYPEPCPIIDDDALIAQVSVELGLSVLTCPNCYDPIRGHKPTGCMLSAFIYVLRDRIGETFAFERRGEARVYTELDLLRTWVQMNTDAFWDDVTPVLNNVQDGRYKADE